MPYDFNPRPPRGERLRHVVVDTIVAVFQSTPSARRATLQRVVNFVHLLEFQSTPSARRATVQSVVNFIQLFEFQSTPSARRATAQLIFIVARVFISIHALREESDYTSFIALICSFNFNPRPPRGERPLSVISGRPP